MTKSFRHLTPVKMQLKGNELPRKPCKENLASRFSRYAINRSHILLDSSERDPPHQACHVAHFRLQCLYCRATLLILASKMILLALQTSCTLPIMTVLAFFLLMMSHFPIWCVYIHYLDLVQFS